ncbi:prenyltransferase/squalene oxidase repeat-containing protein [Tundrisphaera sp. TA3]|uniref:prenyltransferase/squalene oxidase repeat-containing protein n=1 Tax=Tundrisphaera sp. TA3 TaxID=3435775 RepID=UPI003EBF5D9A
MSTTRSRRVFLASGVGTLGLLGLGSLPIAGRARGDEGPSSEAMIARAADFLKGRQDADGSWSALRKEPGITALVVTSLLRSRRITPTDPVSVKALAYLEKFVGPKGGLSEAAHANYATSVALMAFKEANTGGKYDALIKGSQEFLKDKQWDESEDKAPSDPFYGGAGYGGNNSRPDLSNTTFMMEALHDSGLPADDPALQKALVFVSRCQNLKSEFNDQPWAGKINDGGFIYTAANGGTSVAGQGEGGGLRSYASMTYAGLKSMIYAGLKPDDPRVKAATAYIAKHYTLDENPGLGQRGLYYYYQTFSKTMALLGKDTFVDDKGTAHDWRADLTAALASRQDPNGSWVNKADSFMEGDANLVTAYGLLALAHARKA